MLYSKESFNTLSTEEKVTLSFGYLSPSEAFTLAEKLNVNVKELIDLPSTILNVVAEDVDGEIIEMIIFNWIEGV